MRHSQRLQKHLKACRFKHPFGQETERVCLRASVEGSPALPTHLIPRGCSNRARLGVALGKSLSSRCSLIAVTSLMQEENREDISLLPHPGNRENKF